MESHRSSDPRRARGRTVGTNRVDSDGRAVGNWYQSRRFAAARIGGLDPRAADVLGRPIIGQLGFHGLDGYPHVLPVWFEYRDGEVLIASPPGAYKCRSLSRDGRAALSISTVERPYWIVSVVGDAVIERLPEAERIKFLGAIAPRYLGAEAGREYIDAWLKGGHPGDGELIRLRPKKVHFYLS
jgi:pyridoxamine 5'-phosphate oxidase-like protein